MELGLRGERSAQSFALAVRWGDGDDLPDGMATLRSADGTVQPWDPERWKQQLDAHPPLLPHAALDRVISGLPSQLFDAFDRLLGLEVAHVADDSLRACAKTAGERLQAEKSARSALQAAIESSDIADLLPFAAALSRPTSQTQLLRKALIALGAGAAGSSLRCRPIRTSRRD